MMRDPEELEGELSDLAQVGPTTEGPHELPVIPELNDDYEILRELGRGGTAVVYLARERELGRYVAIKLMHPTHTQDEEAMARLVREAKTISRLQHPNIVMLYGTRRLGERGYALILQYVPGTTVKQRLRQHGPFPLPIVERVLNDLGSALQYAHQHRIVHRDIKPENIFLDEDTGAARLADFGIARFWDSDSGLTLPGTALGTPNYMSPEQVDGRKDLDGRSDIYSVGLVAWEMATGRQPWAGETLYNVVYKQKHEELPPLAELRPEMPHYFRKAIEGALKKNPGERWRDAGELLAALQNPYAHLLTQPRPTREAPPQTPSPSASAPKKTQPVEAGMGDADTLVLTQRELERSWARSPARENAPRPDADTSDQRRRTEPRSTPPMGTPRQAGTAPAASQAVGSPQAPTSAPVSTTPRRATPAATPTPQGPGKAMPRWLVLLEEGQPLTGPWALDVEETRTQKARRVIGVGLVLLLLVAIAVVIVLL